MIVKTPAQYRDQLLSTWRNGLVQRGIASPDVGVGTEAYLKCNTLANSLSSLDSSFSASLLELLPDTATGANLERIGALFGLKRKSASPSVGTILFSTSLTSSLVQTGAQLTSSNGLIFAVVAGGAYSDGDSISIQGVSLGSDTNLEEDSILTWVTVPPGAKAKVTVDSDGGLTGGGDAEGDEDLRARIIRFLSNPPGNGNASHLIQIAEASTPGISAACYPAYNGPATVRLAVFRAPSDSDKNRDVDSTLTSSVITNYVSNNYPEHVDLSVTTVTNVSCDVSIGLSLSDNQWKNSSSPRFPSPDSAVGYCAVTAVTSSTVFTLSSQCMPAASLSQVAYVDRSTWTLYRARVLSYTGSGPYTITLDSPFPNIAVGDWVFPDAINLEAYLGALFDYFASMGPGEMTAAAGLLPRALRRPLPKDALPYQMGSVALKRIESIGAEVLDTQFLYRSSTTPAVPSNIANPPNLLVPRKLAFYELL